MNEHLGMELLGHISRDSPAIVDREKPAKKAKALKVAKKKRPPCPGRGETTRGAETA